MTAYLRDGTEPYRLYVISGADPGLVSQELSSLTAELVALDPSAVAPVEEYGQPGRDEPIALGPILDACRTPPFLDLRRIVVMRDASGLDAAQVRELVTYIAEPLETTILVIAHPEKAVPQTLAKAARAAGLVIDTSPGSNPRARGEWLVEHLRDAPVRLQRDAQGALAAHLGEDLSRLGGILETLEAAFGHGATIEVADLEPFLGAAGGVAPWDLTDPIDAGNTEAALVALRRLLEGGERHPLQILATLHRHYGTMLRLDGIDGLDEAGVTAITGVRGFPATKALRQLRRLGHDRIIEAVRLLARADLDLRGQVGWPGETVLDVLIARLSRLSRQPAAARGR